MKHLYLITTIFFLFIGCKDKAAIAKIENEENLSSNLVDESEKLVELSNQVVTAIKISDIVNSNLTEIENFAEITAFFNERNQALYDQIKNTADSLEIEILSKPSELMMPIIEKFNTEEDNESIAEEYTIWIFEYQRKLSDISSWMMKESDVQPVIQLGTSINSYSYALKQALDNLQELS